MNIIFKHTLKNIFKKPFRSIVLAVCVMVTCLTAYLTLDMSQSIEDIFVAYVADMLGNVDLEIGSNKSINMDMLKELPECTALGMTNTSYPVATRDPEQYSYEYVQDLTIYGLDIENGYKMGLFKEALQLTDNETAISKTYAETFGIQEGDTISFYDKNGMLHDFKVVKILEESGVFIAENEYTAVVNQEAIRVLLNTDEIKYYSLMIDVTNDKEVNAFCDYLEEHYPDMEIVRVKGNEDIQKGVMQMVTIFAVLFVVTFLMVIFVTVSLSEKIVNERMAVIGTFRSLGISAKVTTMILLIENVFYGVVGFLLATLFYGAVRDSIMGGMIEVSSGNIVVQPMQSWIYAVVFVGAILVECFTPAKELTKSMKIAIRDIIFANKDTDYVFSQKKTNVGLVLLVAAVLLTLTKNALLLILSMILLVVAVSMLTPIIVKNMALGLGKLFTKVNMPVAELAAKELGTKKNTISNSILCLVIAALAIAMFAIGNGLMAITDHQNYDADICGFGLIQDTEDYKYIEGLDGVSECYFLYGTSDYLKINGSDDKEMYDIMALPNTDMFVGLPDLPQTIAKDECILSIVQADKLKVKEGDTIEVLFKSDYLFPMTKTLKVASLTDASLYSSMPIIIINENLCKDLYHEEVSGMLIRCDDPDSVLKTINKYSLNTMVEFKTKEQMKIDAQKEKAGINTAIYVAIGFGILLSVIGLSGNQVLGFEARRREYAGLYSTSMSQKQVKRLIFLETAFSMGGSVIIGSILGVFLNLIIRNVTKAMMMPLPIKLSVSQYFTMTFVLIVILVLCSLKPVRLMKKMKIAEELKYE